MGGFDGLAAVANLQKGTLSVLQVQVMVDCKPQDISLNWCTGR